MLPHRHIVSIMNDETGEKWVIRYPPKQWSTALYTVGAWSIPNEAFVKIHREIYKNAIEDGFGK